MARRVWVTAYDPAWEAQAAQEARRVQAALGENCPVVYHIGSTSVPGLAAKPIIDIMPVVRSLGAVDGSRAALESLGYEYLGEFGIPGRRYMRKGGDERTHQVHVFAQGDTVNITRHLAFRDFLRAHPDVCAEYAALKRELAARYPYDIDAYCEGKEAFVRRFEAAALAWGGEI